MKIKLSITPADAKKAKDYDNNKNCLLATALKRKFPNKHILVGGTIFDIGEIENIGITKELYDFIDKCYMKDSYLKNPKPIVQKTRYFSIEIKDLE